MRRDVARFGVLFVLVLSPAFSQRVQLVDQPITVRVPAGFVDTSWEHISEGFPLHFSLPFDKDGGRPMYPEISMVATSEAVGTDTMRALSEYARNQAEGTRPLIEPRFIRIAGRPAIESAVSGDAIFDFVGGGASVQSVIRHEISFEYRARLYHCRLDVDGRNYVPYIKVFHEFCNSVRFGASP